MNVAITLDRTSSGKEHSEVLDGLRGSAAFLIVIFHLFNYSFGFQGPWALIKHAYLAVDFFFALSGFVVAYAYDDRWTRMTTLQFFRIRLIRLHPLVLIGATLGLLGYLLDPFSKAMNRGPLSMVLLAYVTSLLLLPSLPVAGRHNESQALNGPAWSLMQEYLGNIAYLSLPASEKSDYWRMYVPEAMAATVYLNIHLADTMGDPTAVQLGLMPLFEQTAVFYKMPAHAALYHNTTDLPGRVTASVANIATNLTQLSDGRTVAHLINHNYSQGFQEQDGVSVSFPVAKAPKSVTLVSPDYGADTPVAFTYSGGLVQVTVPKLVAYVAVVSN